MTTIEDIKIYFKSDMGQDIFGNENDDGYNNEIIQTCINEAYSELSAIKDLVAVGTLNYYAKILSSGNLIDRLGIDRQAFDGLFKRVDDIRKFLSKVIIKKIENSKEIKRFTNIVPDDTKIITDDEINNYLG